MRRLSMARLRTVLARQEPPRYGAEYQPAILATRDEAPAISRCTRIYSHRFGRDLHLLSRAETDAALLAMYHPDLEDFHEQRMLSRWPALHPLQTYPRYGAPGPLPGVAGTLRVAERLGVLPMHPRISIRDEHGSLQQIAYPLIGDLLLILRDSATTLRCVNWNIKSEARQFSEQAPNARRTPHNLQKTLARIAVEDAYYADAEIRTHHIAGAEIDREVTLNLRLLYPYAHQSVRISETGARKVRAQYRAAIENGTPITEVILFFMQCNQYSEFDLRTLYYNAIWHRELRIDLYSPVLIDRTPLAEKKDVIVAYSNWFGLE